MRRRRSSKTNSASGPGPSRTKPNPTQPINIPTVKSSETWPAPVEPFQPHTSQSLPVHHPARAVYHPSLGDCQDLSLSEYLSRSPDDYQTPGLSLTPSPTVARGKFQPQDRSRLSVSSTTPDFAWLSSSSLTSAIDAGMTSVSTANSERMSRSTTNEALIEPFQMCGIGSQPSECDLPVPPPISTDNSSFDFDSLLTGESSPDFTMFRSLSEGSFSSVPSNQSFSESFVPRHVDILPSPSQESNGTSTSSDSSESRHLRRVHEQGIQSKRQLAPKTSSQETTSATPTTNFVETVAEDGTRQRKAQIPRTTRPPKETCKAFCPICDEHKEGYSGEHELRRHINRTHSGFRKVWMCRDISPQGTFLANCQRCRNSKRYGANYNAAAHLRRVHFNPAETPKGGQGKVSQHRGGIGGGDQPPMEFLRNWMVEAWEPNVSGLLLDKSQTMTNSYPISNQLSSRDPSILQSNDTIQISDTDFNFVQQRTQLDMSFLRMPLSDEFSMPPQSSPTSQIFFTPPEQDLVFFDADLASASFALSSSSPPLSFD